ncbi:MAG: pyridoxamine 5'-phosphate oxidase family protein [Candidatus Hodarchaeales archaeon]
MSKNIKTFEFVRKQISKKTFGILGSVTFDGRSHSTGVLYGVSDPKDEYSLYILTNQSYKKVNNITNNPNVSFVIPFPHHFFRFVPSSCVQFQGKAQIVEYEDTRAQSTFQKKRILRMILQQAEGQTSTTKLLFIKIKPNKKIFCYGLGLNLLELRKNPTNARYYVTIPDIDLAFSNFKQRY